MTPSSSALNKSAKKAYANAPSKFEDPICINMAGDGGLVPSTPQRLMDCPCSAADCLSAKHL
jgi:hypothetical protein